ncbi:MAG: M3 family oligoendopeptidase [Thermodesulfobacteriota bacterium]
MTRKPHIDLHSTKVIWDLTDLYQEISDPAIGRDLDQAKRLALRLNERYSGQLATLSAPELKEVVKGLEEVATISAKLASFSYLNFATQVDNPQAGAFLQKIQEELSQISKQTIFFELEFAKLGDEPARELLDAADLDHYRHFLKNIRRFSHHLLDAKEESLLLEIAPVANSSWNSLFDKVMAQLRFGEKQRAEEEVLNDLYSPRREVRQQAAADLTTGLKSQLHVLGHIFNTILADKMISDRLRSYPTWDCAMHLNNELHESTVTTLVSAVQDRYDIVQRYYRLKQQILELPALHDYDRYAPLPHLPQEQISWPRCQEMVLASFADFSPRMAEIASLFFKNNWIHAPITPGKSSGAFAHPCVPEVHPYVMVNYGGNIRDVSTVAHELGHGVHQYLAAEQGYFNSDTPLVLAETASVMAELVLFHTQMQAIAGEEERRAFVCQKLESIFATVFRQVAMNRFEAAIHEERRARGELAIADFNRHWRKNQAEMFGDSVTLSADYDVWWSYIPHFLASPGYVYSYAFGELLVLALYRLFLDDKASFIDNYETLLAAGGSLSPYELVAPFGVNLDEADFWQGGLTIIDQMLAGIE